MAEAALLPAGPSPLSLSNSPAPFGASNSSLPAHSSLLGDPHVCAREPPNPVRKADLYTPFLQLLVVRGS